MLSDMENWDRLHIPPATKVTGILFNCLGTYELDNLFGFDKETGKLHIYSLTNMAETHEHMAGWSDENTLIMLRR